MDHSIKRAQIISKIRNTLVKAKAVGTVLDYEKLLAIVCLENFTSRRTAREYINTIVNSGLAFISAGNIYSLENGSVEGSE